MANSDMTYRLASSEAKGTDILSRSIRHGASAELKGLSVERAWELEDEASRIASVGAEVRKFLTVAARHLPEEFYSRMREQSTFGRHVLDKTCSPFTGEYGVFMYAAEDAEVYEDLDIPESVQALLLHARKEFGCSYVLFDTDGDELDGFVTYEGDEPQDPEADRFVNHYRCPDDGTEWTDNSRYQNNDRCPKCRAEIEPYKSEDL